MTTAVDRLIRRNAQPHPLGVKVPARITVLFWAAKLFTTGTGEAASDFLGGLSLVLAAVVGLGGFALAMRWQLRCRVYRAELYWFAVTMVAVFGTMAADVIHVVLGVPYALSTTFWGAVLVVVLVWWYRSEGTLSIHSIDTRRRERFYWLTVLSSFALGTAAGDLTATELNLGFLDSGYLFLAAMAIPLVAWRLRWVNGVAAFWIAYVLTRPLGASFADWLGKPHSIGRGVGLGDGPVTAAGAVLIVACVVPMVLAQRNAARQEPDRTA